ncbi:MAG: winged helix DNA-binding domain-containing protein [Acidimicrobiia bacterium]|nr:winged helix DNA-binding domain-containing protein [Acidimicrobiia bacterium]
MEIGPTERRRRLVERQHVGVPADDVDTAVANVVALHGTDPVSVYLQLWARVPGITLEDIQDVLYEERGLIKVTAMRRTMFLPRAEDATRVMASSAPKVWRTERKRIADVLADSYLDPLAQISSWEDLAVKTIREHGQLSTAEIKKHAPELAGTFVLGKGTKFPTKVSIATRVMLLLAAEGRVVRGRPLGSWLGSQYRWALPEGWSPSLQTTVDEEEASRWLVERWLRRFGPGSLLDLVWWTGWTKTKARQVLATLDVTEVDIGADQVGLVMSDDLEETPETEEPAVALLPGLDATVMGWKERDWYMKPEMVPLLVDSVGNVGPTAWVDGQVVGGWGVDPTDMVRIHPLTPIDDGARHHLEVEAGRLESWLDGRRFTWRFDSPLHLAITNGDCPPT